MQLNVSQHTKIKQNQLSFNNPEDIHDFPLTYNNLYMTFRHSLSHLYISTSPFRRAKWWSVNGENVICDLLQVHTHGKCYLFVKYIYIFLHLIRTQAKRKGQRHTHGCRKTQEVKSPHLRFNQTTCGKHVQKVATYK